jgi:transposase-like protein
MVRDHEGDYGSVTAACVPVGGQLGIARETLRRWVEQAAVDDGTRPGVSSEESAEIKALRRENRRLREANEMADSCSDFLCRVSASAGARRNAAPVLNVCTPGPAAAPR